MNGIHESIKLSHRVYANWRILVTLATLGSIIYLLMAVQGTPGNIVSFLKGNNGLYNLQMFFFYYVPFECISIAIFIWLIPVYHRLIKRTYVRPTLPGLLRYELLLLPLILGSVLIFGPITNTVRYLVINCPVYSWQNYFPEYFMTSRMYFKYLLPMLVIGYTLINTNLFLSYQAWQQQTKPSGNDLPITDPVVLDDVAVSHNYLDVYDQEGQTLLALQEVHYIEVKAKNYIAFTADQAYRIRATLAKLEAALPICQFYRINRSVIINLKYVKNYSFWENDKYIVRLKDNGKEFIMQRARLDEFRKRLTDHGTD